MKTTNTEEIKGLKMERHPVSTRGFNNKFLKLFSILNTIHIKIPVAFLGGN